MPRCRLLREGGGAKALVHFEKALMLAKFLGNRVQERRAVRGLAAAARIQVGIAWTYVSQTVHVFTRSTGP